MAGSAARLRLLAIDDEPSFGDLIVRVLRRLADVTFVTSIADAAPFLAVGELDVIICDLNLPCGGAAAVERMVAAVHPELVPRIVYVTGGAFTSDCATFLARVSAQLVPKPFTPNELCVAVESAAATPCGGR